MLAASGAELPWRADGEADLWTHVPSALNAASFGLQDHCRQHSTSLNQQDGAKSSSSVPHYNGKHPRSPENNHTGLSSGG